jgi:hypothetical protein
MRNPYALHRHRRPADRVPHQPANPTQPTLLLIHAAASARSVEALALMAPHVFVEPRTLESMPHPRGLLLSDLRARWANYHAHVDDAFLGWADTWLQPQFPILVDRSADFGPWTALCC